MADKFFLRPITEEELETLDQMTQQSKFDFGVHNWAICFKASPKGFFFVVETGSNRIAGIFTKNTVSNQLVYGHDIFVLPEFRGRGIANMIYDIDLMSDDNLNETDCKNAALMRSLHRAWILGHKLIEYNATVSDEMLEVVDRLVGEDPAIGFAVFRLGPHNPGLLDQMLEYDQELYESVGIDAPFRQDFIRSWSDDPTNAVTMVAVSSDGLAIGYGIARRKNDTFYQLCPVYAETPHVGKLILLRLAQSLPIGAILSVEFPADNPTALRFAQSLGLNFEYAEYRTYSRESLNLPLAKIFAHHDFWPV